MKVIAVRHTSVDVLPGICYGQTDVETASTFEVEMEQVAQKLLQEDFQAVYSSPLKRCRMLAEYVSKGIPVIYDSRLMELNFGIWEGLPWDQIGEKEDAQLWFSDWINTPCPEGESYQQLIARVKDFLQQLIPYHENVLIITHAGVIRALISLLDDMEPRKAFDMKIDYGTIIKLETHE